MDSEGSCSGGPNSPRGGEVRVGRWRAAPPRLPDALRGEGTEVDRSKGNSIDY